MLSNPTVLYTNLRLFVRKNDCKRAGQTAASIAQCERVTIVQYLKFVGKLLMEDKFPEGAHFLNKVTFAIARLNRNKFFQKETFRKNTFVTFAVAAAKLPTSSKPFQFAFVYLQKGLSNFPAMENAVEEAILYQSPKDSFEVPDGLDQISLKPFQNVPWCNDYVLMCAWCALMKNPDFYEKPLPTVNTDAYKPLQEHQMLYQEKKRANYSGDLLYQNEVKDFMKYMEDYMQEHTDTHYGSPIPLLADLRTKARLRLAVPKEIDGVPTVIQKTLRTGWWIESTLPEASLWIISHPKIQTKINMEKLKTMYQAKRKNGFFGVESTALRAVKWKHQVYFMEQRLEAKPLTAARLEQNPHLAPNILKILVYRHAEMLRTTRKDILMTGDGVVSSNETVKKVLIRHPNVWKKLIEAPSSKAVAPIVEQLTAYLKQHASTFKTYMEQVRQIELYESLMQSIND